MARVFKPGERIGSYRIVRELNRGLMAISYEAQPPARNRVFLKQYKSPSIRVPWYRDYLNYQRLLKDRIDSTPCAEFCYRFLDFFEYERQYFQVFEFLDKSASLEQMLERTQKNPDALSDKQRLILARVMMFGISTLHRHGIIHSDLKPANLMLVEDRGIAAGYKLRIIDMDFSLLVGQRAPWDGDCGYYGTPGYMSPEHLTGQVPQSASDVFTCGIILCELLAGQHPFAHLLNDEDRLRIAYVAHGAAVPKLRPGVVKELPNAPQVAQVLHQCLAPTPSERPTAAVVNLILCGKEPSAEEALPVTLPADLNGHVGPIPLAPARPEPATPATGSTLPAPRVPPARPVRTGTLVLRSEDGKERSFNVRTSVGRDICSYFGSDSQFMESVQFILDRQEDGWFLIPHLPTRNETILNGRQQTERVRLEEGDVVGVGRESRGVVKLPLTVSFR